MRATRAHPPGPTRRAARSAVDTRPEPAGPPPRSTKLATRVGGRTRKARRAMPDESGDRSLLEQELAGLAASGAVADIYRERLVRHGVLARILQWSEHVVIIEQLDDNYLYDGISAVRPGDITRIRSD